MFQENKTQKKLSFKDAGLDEGGEKKIRTHIKFNENRYIYKYDKRIEEIFSSFLNFELLLRYKTINTVKKETLIIKTNKKNKEKNKEINVNNRISLNIEQQINLNI